MAIMEGPSGTQADTAQTVWELAEGFAILARISTAQGHDAVLLHRICNRMRDRCVQIGRDALSEHLRHTCEALAPRAMLPNP